MSARILVTGATGYIGAFLVPRLVAEGHEIKAFARAPIHVASEFEVNVAPVIGDLLDTDALTDAMRGVDVVYHLAGFGSPATLADQDQELIGTNVVCTQSVLRAAESARVRRVIFSSSAAVYGDLRDDPKREDMGLIPTSTYAVSKIAAEHLSSMFHRHGAFETVIVRIFNVYGPFQQHYGHDDKFVPRCVRSIREGGLLKLRGDGVQTRDYIHVEDVVEGLVRALNSPLASGRTINLGTGKGVSIRCIIDYIADELHVEPQTVTESLLSSEVMQATADIAEMYKVLGAWNMTELVSGLRQVVEASSSSEHIRWWHRASP